MAADVSHRRESDAPAPRYKRTILATCCVPWTEGLQFAEATFRRSVKLQLARGFRDLYIFGTAGEGHSVSDSDYRRVVDVFVDEIRSANEEPMVGVISNSLPTVVDRIEYAADQGCTTFQLSLPNWGVLNDAELEIFFQETCGRFPKYRFLHYNLSRSGRILGSNDYARLAATHDNLVATKYGGGDPELIAGFLTGVPQLRHFFTAFGFFYGSVIGECGLLSSIGSTNPARDRMFYDAASSGDLQRGAALYRELAEMMLQLRSAVGSGPHLDGAYDKILAKIGNPAFPLRLIPPWQESTEEAYVTYKEWLQGRFPEWIAPAPPH